MQTAPPDAHERLTSTAWIRADGDAQPADGARRLLTPPRRDTGHRATPTGLVAGVAALVVFARGWRRLWLAEVPGAELLGGLAPLVDGSLVSQRGETR